MTSFHRQQSKALHANIEPDGRRDGSDVSDGETALMVAAFYNFAKLEDLELHQQAFIELGTAHGVKGTLLLAPEGVNGTVAGPREGIDAFLAAVRRLPGCSDMEHKESSAARQPFGRLRIRLKREIVTIREPLADPNTAVGTYVAPEDWNALIADPDVIVIDTRNDYEVEIGTFEGAINPETGSFGEFPKWVQDNLDTSRHRKVAMFCTGGIRCEKASAFLKNTGFDEVYHLKGGILKYLEDIPADDSRWQGECFVFDGRVALRHGLEPGSHAMCETCNHAYDKDTAKCPHCGSTRRFGPQDTQQINEDNDGSA